MVDTTGMRKAAEKVQSTMPGHSVMLNAANVLALLDDREALKKERDEARDRAGAFEEGMTRNACNVVEVAHALREAEASVETLGVRLAEAERERDEARRHLGYSERVLIGLLKKARDGLALIAYDINPGYPDDDLVDIQVEARGMRRACAILAEIEAALAQPGAEPRA